MVAIKQIKISDGLTEELVKEISILKEMKHNNIVKLYDVIHEDTRVSLILEFVDMDLEAYLRRPDLADAGVLHPKICRSFMHQLLLGMEHLHLNGVMHRDLKPSNLLISSRGILKIADFGLARVDLNIEGTELEDEIIVKSNRVVTLYYRAPEIIMGSSWYGVEIDVWSIGCIFGEMMLGRPIFHGRDRDAVLLQVFGLFGTPSSRRRQEIRKTYKKMKDYNFPKIPPKELKTVFKLWSPLALELLKEFLRFRPHKRITCTQALQHTYITDHKGLYTAQEAEHISDRAPSKPATQLSILMTLVNYRIIRPIGEGTYGKVYLGQEETTGDLVAVKEIEIDENIGVTPNIVKEISILKTLQNDRVIRLYDVVHLGLKMQLVLEFMDLDLSAYMQRPDMTDNGVVSPPVCRSFMHQLLRGVSYLHNENILHRDLKPANLLINLQRGELKIADFGLAHVWSVGVILAEMMHGSPVFREGTEQDMLRAIFRLIGVPNPETQRYAQKQYAQMRDFDFDSIIRRNHDDFFPLWPSIPLDLMERLLTFLPSERPSCESMLGHPYFLEGPTIGNPNPNGRYTLQEKEQLVGLCVVH
ncbi:negative regulator of the PHO system [Cystobasidiomycetes sp. EMM_F5]